MGSSMLIGFNNDVEYKGRMFHIQTEDHGIKDGHITTILFFSGQILDSKKISYQADVEGVGDTEDRKKAIKKRMVQLHREFYKKLFDGNYEDKVKELAKKEGDDKPAKPESTSAAIKKAKAKPAASPPPIKTAAKPPPLKKPALPKPPPLRTLAKKKKPPAPVLKEVKNPAFRGLRWPEAQELRLDGLVAEFLESA